MNRFKMLRELESNAHSWDVIIIGGGATGLGAFVDAASRGFRTLLVEQHDFAKATSSRSTKLIHGGLRYLQQGNLSLVREGLKERGLLIQNAPHLIMQRPFVVPSYRWWENSFYGLGLKIYDLLAGKLGLQPSRCLSRDDVLRLLPNIEQKNLRGGTLFYDGQFDDARLAITLARTGVELGGTALNYMRVNNLLFKNNQVVGVHAIDQETDQSYEIYGKAIINATGVFCDEIRAMENEACTPLIAPSQGIHLVFSGDFLSSETALLVPHTSDGRVLFILPWHGKLLIGTTDTPNQNPALEPIPFEDEIDFVINTAARYLNRKPTREDILSKFAGLRPLFSPHRDRKLSRSISRDHHIEIGPKKLISVCGGKWTTYRKMAEDTINQAIKYINLPAKECNTQHLQLYGYQKNLDPEDSWSVYGSDLKTISELKEKNPALAQLIDPAQPIQKVQVVWACQNEMALHIEDVLSRRTRTLLLDAKAALQMAQPVAEIMANELGRNCDWIHKEVQIFHNIAKNYI